MPEIPFSPPRELSQMLVFSATEDLNEPLKPRRPLTLLSHHDGIWDTLQQKRLTGQQMS